MILFFETPQKNIIATEINHQPCQEDIDKLCWLFGQATCLDAEQLEGFFVGPQGVLLDKHPR